MSMLPAVYLALTQDPAVAALVATRVYRHGSAPQGVDAPYCTWVSAGAPSNTFNGADADAWRVQVDCWADDDTQVETLAAAVREALEARAVLVSYLTDERDPVTQRFRFGMAFDWIAGRNL